jgi:calcium-dependent protein kinase
MGCSHSNTDEFQWKSRKEGRLVPKKINTESELKLNNSSLVRGKTNSISETYKLIKKLGSGTFGMVYKVKHLSTDTYRAMKVVKKDTINYQDDEKQFLKEIEILSELDHPNIIKIYEYYVDEINYYVMSELATGGELYDQIYKIKSYTEAVTAIIMEQLFSAVAYIHSKGIVHRDIKPENILLETHDTTKEPFIKLIDFGTANYIKDNNNLHLKVGTPYYIAPEVLKKDYNKSCDVWSLGVIMYFLLSGSPPFDGTNDLDIFHKILKGEFSMQTKEWEEISVEAKSLISKLLTYDYKIRITAAQAQNDSWVLKFSKIRKNLTENSTEFSLQNLKRPFENLRRFSAKQKLQQSTIAFLVRQISNSELVKSLRNIFRTLDKNGDGTLSFDEIKEGFKKYYGEKIGEKEWEQIIKNLDQDGSNTIEYEEFIRCTINLEDVLTEKNLKLAFNSYDKDGSGYLDIDEIKTALGILDSDNVNMQIIQNIINSIDENGDGEISFNEFKELMLRVLNNNGDKEKDKEKEKNKTINMSTNITGSFEKMNSNSKSKI